MFLNIFRHLKEPAAWDLELIIDMHMLKKWLFNYVFLLLLCMKMELKGHFEFVYQLTTSLSFKVQWGL